MKCTGKCKICTNIKCSKNKSKPAIKSKENEITPFKIPKSK
jgi:hypothetical protein